jgi:DNA glycosylase AlkZ-like
MRHFDAAERRRRLLVRHHLARPDTTVELVAGDLVGLHSSDPASVVLSLRARLDPFAVSGLEDALYERRSLLRMLAMRRTMFVVPLDLAAVMDASCTKALVAGERRKLVQMLVEAGVTNDVETWIDRVRADTLAALTAADGPLPASGLTRLVPELGLQLRMAVGKKYESRVGVSTRLLFLMSTEGVIVRARPLGSWLSSQYRWARAADWIGALPAIAPDVARAELVRRWLRAFGPGTIEDLAWWTKWTKAQVKAALATVGAVEVTADTGAHENAAAWVLADDLDDTAEVDAVPGGLEPVALLPALDSTVMGWKERGWYLGGQGPRLFDRNGNAGPTVWAGGRAVGAWSQREGGKVVTALVESVDTATAARIDAAASRLSEWMDGVRVTPRFTNPLERELANGPFEP